MTIQCCVCKKYHLGGVWTHAEPPSPQRVSHSYCPGCYEQACSELRAQRRREKLESHPTAARI